MRESEQSGRYQNADVPAENQDGIRPWNLVRERQYQEQGTQKQLVRDRVQVLAEHGLLVQDAGQLPIEHVADVPSLGAEIMRVLRPGGYCMITTPARLRHLTAPDPQPPGRGPKTGGGAKGGRPGVEDPGGWRPGA